MRVFFRITFFTAVLFSLCGCISQQNTAQTINDRASCKQNCLKRAQSCAEQCHDNCHECSRSATRSAAMSYNKYKMEQVIQGGMMARDLNSYRDPLQCRKISCDCSADYQVCVQSCGGRIYKRLQTTKVCS